MNLETATKLLEGSARYFSEIYKLYEFKEEQLLKEYLDFIIHEPVEWLKGFPSKLTQKGSLSRPKAAIIKLLKMDTVIQDLGEEYTKKVYNVIWITFKEHVDTIVAYRTKKQEVGSSSSSPIEPVPPILRNEYVDLGDDNEDETKLHEDTKEVECESVHTVCTKHVLTYWERKYRILESAYVQLLKGDREESTAILLRAFSESSSV